jgi:hypothetical protein
MTVCLPISTDKRPFGKCAPNTVQRGSGDKVLSCREWVMRRKYRISFGRDKLTLGGEKVQKEKKTKNTVILLLRLLVVVLLVVLLFLSSTIKYY